MFCVIKHNHLAYTIFILEINCVITNNNHYILEVLILEINYMLNHTGDKHYCNYIETMLIHTGDIIMFFSEVFHKRTI